MSLALKLQIPEKLSFLLEPHRWKVPYGGRASTKSWSVARTLIAKGYAKPERTLCVREVQNSIKESVYALLKDQAEFMGLSGFYRPYATEIRGANGTVFNFEGLASHTIDSLKSYEGYDNCWVEEAHGVCKRSWDVLIPTIRKPGSEFYITFNPDLDTDEAYKRFITNPPYDCISQHMTWRDNPWLSEESNRDRLHCKLTQPDDYPNIWMGACRPAAVGAIYYKEVEEAIRNRRIGLYPYDPFLKVHIVFDLGWNDSMGIILVQRDASSIRIIDYIEGDHKTYDWYSAELRKRNYNWGRVWLPHDGFSGDPKTGKTTQVILQKLGWDVADREEIVELPVENGIKVAKMTFPRIYFNNAPQTQEQDELGGMTRLFECLKRFKRIENRRSGDLGHPQHDQYSNGADAFRYTCLNIDKMHNEERHNRVKTSGRGTHYGALDSGVGI